MNSMISAEKFMVFCLKSNFNYHIIILFIRRPFKTKKKYVAKCK